MKLTYSPASPFARKVRIAAIELGLIDRIELSPVAVAPGQPNDEYSKIHPLKKLPVLILDDGDVVVDSYVIVEYLDELAGGGKLIPASGTLTWKVKSDHSLLQRVGLDLLHSENDNYSNEINSLSDSSRKTDTQPLLDNPPFSEDSCHPRCPPKRFHMIRKPVAF